MAAAAIADIAVIVIDYQVTVPEHYGSKILEASSSGSDHQGTYHDELKNHILNDSEFLNALKEAMRIRVIPSTIHQQLQQQQAIIACNQKYQRKKRLGIVSEDFASRAAKKKRMTTQCLSDTGNESESESESESEREEGIEGSKMSQNDDSSIVSFLSESGRKKEKTNTTLERKVKKEHLPEVNVPNCAQASLNHSTNDNREDVSGTLTASSNRKREMKKYVIGNINNQHHCSSDNENAEQRETEINAGQTAGQTTEPIAEVESRTSAREKNCRHATQQQRGTLETMAEGTELYLQEAEGVKSTIENSERTSPRLQPEDCTKWMHHFQLLKEYKQAHGNCDVPTVYPLNRPLGKWVSEMRYHGKRYLNGKSTHCLNKVRFRILDDINFNWFTRVHWNEFFPLLLRYKCKYGHCNVSMKCEDSLENLKLGRLAQFICHNHRMLTKGQCAKLDDIGFSFSDEISEAQNNGQDRKEPQQTLVDLPKRAGNSSPDGLQESSTDQNSEREQCRLEQLEKWSKWMYQFNLLKEYRKEHGNCNVPTVYEPNKSLGMWVSHMRYHGKRYMDGKSTHTMNETRFRMLDDIGLNWFSRVRWDEFFPLLQQYKSEHGHCNVPRECKENLKLGILADFIRHHHSCLTLEQYLQLDGIGFEGLSPWVRR